MDTAKAVINGLDWALSVYPFMPLLSVMWALRRCGVRRRPAERQSLYLLRRIVE